MKIVFLIDSLHKGGTERRLVELIKHLNEAGTVSIVLALLQDIIEYPEVKEIKNIVIKIIPRKSRKDLRVFSAFYRLVKKEKPDIVHTWGLFAPVVAVPACTLLKIKFVNSIVSTAKVRFLSNEHIRSRLTIPFSSMVLCNSYAGQKAFKVPRKKAKVIYNGYNFRRNQISDSEQLRKKIGVHTKYVVGMVGAFLIRKDYKTYILAASHILKQRRDISFLCVGDGILLENMKLLNKEVNPYPEQVLFLGQIHNVEPVIQLCDIGVLTTNAKKYFEGISNSIMEFMAQGKPVIASAGGGTNEIIVENQTGYLIEPFDYRTLAKLILELIDSPTLIQQFGKSGQDRIQNMFNIKEMVSETYNCYKQLI